MARKRALKAAPKVKDGVDKILASIAKLKSGQLEGSNNPKLKAYAAYGVKEHRSRQDSCDAKEILISGDYCKNPNPKRHDCKLDCVKRCTIVEIKPKDAADLGWKQSRAYVDGLKNMYLAHKRDGKNMFTGPFQRFEACLSSDKATLEVTPNIELYDFCPKAADLAEPIENVDVTIPSEAE
ncbi:MAG: hypothetical protein HS111_11935 [Kofleriaceae bacterium]|nr:hypothetical protein [Kofleriaceae bacterium]MCL4227274.1 hypothetical protein [Myxococcales bacterium]